MPDLPPRRVVVAMLEPPLPFGNAAARWYYVLLRGLTERGHRLTVYAACPKPAEMDAARDLFPAPAYDLRCFAPPRRTGLRAKLETGRRPYSYMFGPDLRRDLDATLADGFDVLHLEQLWCGWLGLRHRGRALVNVHYLASIDLADVPAAGLHGRAVRWLMRRAERRLLRGYAHFVTLTPRLTDAVRRVNPAARVGTVPLGLDLSLYPYTPDERRPREPVVSLIGSMCWAPSRSAAVRFLTRLWPEIKRRVPAARAQVIGWQARTALRDFLALPDVSILENVADIRPYFEGTGVLLYAPSRGSGMKVKVLEALAFGVPVVTTSEGIEGLPAEDDVHAGVCEDDAGLIERTVRLLGDRAAQDRQRAAGRELVERHCGPGPTLDALEAFYAGLTARGTGDRPAVAATAAGAGR